VGIDTGGTFTDIVVLDALDGTFTVTKRPSRSDDPGAVIMEGLERSAVNATDISYLVLGTTVGINAIHQRRGAHVIYVTTQGFEDVPFSQRSNRKFHYDLEWKSPVPLVNRRDSFGIDGRLSYQGDEVQKMSLGSQQRLAELISESISDNADREHCIAVNLLFSYVNDEHEKEIARFLKSEFPQISLSISSQVAPIWREYDRASTTLADAYIRPLMTKFVSSLESGLQHYGYRRPWSVMKSNGGQMQSSAAGEMPVQTVLSGISGGIIAARHFGQLCDELNVIGLDIGGTSTDVGLVVDGLIKYTLKWEIEWGLPVAAPFVEINSLGAGGGSIASIDPGGRLVVGPQSAGSEPGPASYGQGGQAPTVTDANVILGRINPKFFLGGEIDLSVDLAHAAVSKLATALHAGVYETAHAITELAAENIAESVRQLTVSRGIDPRNFSIVALGGAGPLHASAVASAVGAKRVIIPPHPGLGSAFGTLLADKRVDKTWTHFVRSTEIDAVDIDLRLRELADLAITEIRQEGFIGNPHIIRTVSMRYMGQNYEEELNIPDGPVDEASIKRLIDSFHKHYEGIYGYHIADEIIELVQFNVTAIGLANPPKLKPVFQEEAPSTIEYRSVWFNPDEPVDTPVYRRNWIQAGEVIVGPAVIEELDSTILVCPNEALTITGDGIGILELGITSDC